MNVDSAAFNEAGMIVAVIDDVLLTIPDDASNEHRQAVAAWESDGNTIETYEAGDPAAAPVVLFPADLWRRADRPGEAEKIDAAMRGQPVRIRRLFEVAQEYRSDDPLWPLLSDAAEALFGKERAAELLAPSM